MIERWLPIAGFGGRYEVSDRGRVRSWYTNPCPEGMECLHGPDYSPGNNALTNLRWGTRKQNVAEMYAAQPELRARQQATRRIRWHHL
jgi:hypothetical protein